MNHMLPLRVAALVPCWFGIITVWTATTCGLYGGDLYVNNATGDDLRNGRSPESKGAAAGPVRTIAQALRLAKSGDRIVLTKTAEPYRESLTLQASNHSGLLGSPFEIVGNGATLDGTRPVPAGAWQHVRGDVYRFRLRKKAFQLLYLNGQPASRREVPETRELPDLKALEYCLLKGDLYFRAAPGKAPGEHNLRHTALPVGITLYEAREVIVRDLVIQGFQLDGINAHDGVFGAQLTGLICRGNGRSGISVGGASRVLIENCLVGNNGIAQVRTEGSSITHLVGNDLIDDGRVPALLRRGGKVHIQASEPAAPEKPEPVPSPAKSP
ncbi:MAG: hypothetical protein CMJ59_15885 [Planctomycetaceae bacterium]|nr:hypothetical protein [Planctomycetaceae bacterium]